MTLQGISVACVGTLLCFAMPAQAGDEETVERLALLSAFFADITGDGIPDTVTFDRSGRDSLKAVDGATGRVLWETEEYDIGGWAEASRSGRIGTPVLFDIDQDGLQDFIFSPAPGNELVALSHKTGALLWKYDRTRREQIGQSAVPGIGRRLWGWDWTNEARYRRESGTFEGRSRLDYIGEGYVLDGNLLLVGEFPLPSQAKKGRPAALIALDPKDGAAVWTAEIERCPAEAAKRDDGFDVRREVAGKHVTLTFSEPPSLSLAGGNKLRALTGLSETARLLVTGERVLYFGRHGLRAISRKDGAVLWSWTIEQANDYQDAAVIERGGDYFVFAWLGDDDFLVASIRASDGVSTWTSRLSLKRKPSNLLRKMGLRDSKRPWSRILVIDLADDLTIIHRDPDAKAEPRQVVIDPETGKIEGG